MLQLAYAFCFKKSCDTVHKVDKDRYIRILIEYGSNIDDKSDKIWI